MSLEEFAVAGVFGIPAVLFTTWTGYYLWTALRIAASEPVSVGEAAARAREGEGTGEFVGTARPADDGTFDAPFSGERALLSTYRVEQKGGPSDSWLTESAGSIDRPVLVEDEGESDRILVDPAGATISPGNESIRERTGDALPNEVRLRLSHHQADLESELEEIFARNATRSRRYAEGYVAPGDRVHVYGGEFEDSDELEVDATVVGGDGRYRITGGGESTAAWEFIEKAAVTGSMSVVAGGGAIVALSAAL
ncbi:hypothetical protein [Halomontanus rarus]|uniref:hypothetical protein n=1 Tax=Halomontanus rarus TaxID=3034020 RepID=UPI001A981EB1